MQTFNLDLSVKKVIPLLNVKQRDVGSKILVNITNNGDAYAVPADASFSVWYSGASGEGNYTKIGDNSAFSASGNAVTVELIHQMLNRPGAGNMCLVMNGAEGSQLGLWNIPYYVEGIPGADSAEATNYYNLLHEAQINAEASRYAAILAKNIAETAADEAEAAAAEAAASALKAEQIGKPTVKIIDDMLVVTLPGTMSANIIDGMLVVT